VELWASVRVQVGEAAQDSWLHIWQANWEHKNLDQVDSEDAWDFGWLSLLWATLQLAPSSWLPQAGCG